MIHLNLVITTPLHMHNQDIKTTKDTRKTTGYSTVYKNQFHTKGSSSYKTVTTQYVYSTYLCLLPRTKIQHNHQYNINYWYESILDLIKFFCLPLQLENPLQIGILILCCEVRWMFTTLKKMMHPTEKGTFELYEKPSSKSNPLAISFGSKQIQIYSHMRQYSDLTHGLRKTLPSTTAFGNIPASLKSPSRLHVCCHLWVTLPTVYWFTCKCHMLYLTDIFRIKLSILWDIHIG